MWSRGRRPARRCPRLPLMLGSAASPSCTANLVSRFQDAIVAEHTRIHLCYLPETRDSIGGCWRNSRMGKECQSRFRLSRMPLPVRLLADRQHLRCRHTMNISHCKSRTSSSSECFDAPNRSVADECHQMSSSASGPADRSRRSARGRSRPARQGRETTARDRTRHGCDGAVRRGHRRRRFLG